MEQVMAPNFKFKSKLGDDDKAEKGEIKVRGFKTPSSKRVRDIIDSDLNDLKATILQDDTMLKAIPGQIDPEVINRVLIPKIIQTKYPNLTEDEVEEVRQYVVLDSVIKNNLMIDVDALKQAIRKDEQYVQATGDGTDSVPTDLIPKIVRTLYPDLSDSDVQKFSGMVAHDGGGIEGYKADQRFIRMAGQFVNIDDLHIDLIDTINPFQKAYEILSKSVTTKVLKVIQDAIESTRIQVSEDEAVIMWPKIKSFYATFQREPSLQSADAIERRMAEVLLYIKDQKRKQQNG